MKRCLIFFVLLLFYISSFSQEKLNLNDAISIALKNNYSIILSGNDLNIAKNNNNIANAGFLPDVSLSANGYKSNNDVHQKYNNGNEVNRDNSKSEVINVNAGLNWTLFDGFRMFANHEKLKQLEEMGELNFKQSVENTVASVMIAYYNIIMQKNLLRVIDSTIAIDEEKLRIAELKYNIGSGSNLEYLQAKVDMNAQKSLRLKQSNNILNAKLDFNFLLSRNPDAQFDVEDSILIDYNPDLSNLKTSVKENNTQLNLFAKNIQLSASELKINKSLFYPNISFNLDYNLSYTKNQAGFILLNRNNGFATGFGATWSIFNGLTSRTLTKNAKINLISSEIQLKEMEYTVESGLLKAFLNFKNNMEILALEEENIKFAKENLNVAIEKYRLGNINSIILKEAEISYQDALTRLVVAGYDAKLSQIELMRLNGDLVLPVN